MAVSEDQFRDAAEEALEDLDGALARAGIDSDLEGGVLRISFDDGAKFVVSPNAPARQIWVSARLSSFKFDLTPRGFELGGEALRAVMQRLVREQLGDEAVDL